MCELLLNHKDINIDAIDDEGYTPLDIAIDLGRIYKDFALRFLYFDE